IIYISDILSHIGVNCIIHASLKKLLSSYSPHLHCRYFPASALSSIDSCRRTLDAHAFLLICLNAAGPSLKTSLLSSHISLVIVKMISSLCSRHFISHTALLSHSFTCPDAGIQLPYRPDMKFSEMDMLGNASGLYTTSS